MAFENVQFLLSRYTTALEEVEKDHNQVPLNKRFHNIREIIEKKMISPMPEETRDVLKESLDDLNEALTSWQTLSKYRIRGLPIYSPKQLCFICKTELLLSKTKQKLNNISDASPSSSSIDSVIKERQTSEMCDTSKIFGFDDKMIIESLQRQSNDGFNAVGIVGMGGSGKTTLAQLVFNNERVRKEFMPRIWVPLSGTLDKQKDLKKDIVLYLLQELGHEECESTSDDLNELLLILHRHLSGKKYLIVLDDVWHIDSWYQNLGSKPSKEEERRDHLAYGLPKGYGGGIIVTGRLEEIVEQMVQKEHLHKILPDLDRENCWSIFMRTMEEEHKDGSYDYNHIYKMKDEIVTKCNGLPLAAKTLGQIFAKISVGTLVIS